MKAMGRERFREFRAPDSMIRPLKTFQVRIGGLDVPIAPAAFADLHDTDLVKVWKEGEAVYCMFQGRDGVVGYQATFAFMPGPAGWAQALKTFRRKGSVKVETRKVVVQDQFETEGVD
jgi:hypothetical protein